MSAKKKSNKGRRPSGGPSRQGRAKPAAARSASTGQAPATKTSAGAPAAGKSAGGQTAARATPATKPPRERSGPTKAERLAAAEAARRRRRLRNRALTAAALAAVIVAITLVVVDNRREARETARQLEAGGCQLDGESDSDAGAGRNHVPSPSYEVNPPAGGNHTAQAAQPGVYTATNAPPEGQVVHSMEHGYVILWHAPELPGDQVEQLRTLANKYDRDVLMVPRVGMPVPVAATAWHRRLLCGSGPDVAAMEKFIVEFRNQGPEKVPH